MKPQISVVIPTYKRPQILKRCLTALSQQTLGKTAYEIIVVSDGPDEQTKKIVDYVSKTSQMNVYFFALPKHQGPATARNVGVSKTHTGYLAFTDDDCIPDSSWLLEGMELFKTGTQAFSGNVIVPLAQNPTDADISLSHLETASFVTANCFCTKKIFQKVGGFSKEFPIAWREDSDFEFKLKEAGIIIGKAKKATVIHPPKPHRWGVSIFDQKKAMYNALLYKKHKKLYKRCIQPLPPLHYYAIVVAFLGFLVTAFLKQQILAAAFLAIWTYLTLSFIIQRIHPVQKSFSHMFDMIISSLLIPPLAIFWRLKGAYTYKVLFF